MSCSVFDISLLQDIAPGSVPTSKLDKLRSLINDYDPGYSGIWQPMVIAGDGAPKGTYSELLVQPNVDNVSTFDPCNCNDDQILSLGAGFYDNYKESNFNTSYCGNYSVQWRLYDSAGNSSEDVLGADGVFDGTCDNGACDVMFKKDDFIPRIPMINQSYISGFSDFKHLSEFPACGNVGLGWERFFEYNVSDFNTLDVTSNAKFCIDWQLKEIISEVPYDSYTSQHINEYTHDKSYTKSLETRKTCGNFILTGITETGVFNYNIFNDVDTASEIPASGDFDPPFGFKNNTYNNIFIGGKKMASHWKWDHQSGVLGWYRYYDKDRTDDKRPIKGVDLYISPGDVFWSTLTSPEPKVTQEDLDDGSFVKKCPSGVKVIDGATFKGIIPHGSTGLYISTNIYPKFYKFYEKYTKLGLEHSKARDLSALMATSPLYDGYTVDLLHYKSPMIYGSNNVNDFNQIAELSVKMQSGTRFKSYNGLDYVETSDQLINSLYNKYGGYLWFPPNGNYDVKFNLDSSEKSIYVDLDFDSVINPRTAKKAGSKKYSRLPNPNCSVNSNPNYKFYYDQTIAAGSSKIETSISDKYNYSSSCSEDADGNVTYNTDTIVKYANINFNGRNISNVPIFHNGAYTLSGVYSRITKDASDGVVCTDCDANSTFYLVPDAETALCTPARQQAGSREEDKATFCYDRLSNFLNNSEGPNNEPGQRPLRGIINAVKEDIRYYKSLPFNPHIDLVAFHEKGGVYYNSTVFDKNQSVAFVPDNAGTFNNITISFATKDLGIKLNSFSVERLQSSDRSTASCKRFPIDVSGLCKCYGLNLKEYPSLCGGNRTNYSTASSYIPSLSTRNSPKLEYYGGFTPDEVSDLFGVTVPPKAEKYLPNITSKIDPENPYNCEKSTSINIGNYTTTNLNISLKNFDSNHSDIYASVSESMDYIAPAMNETLTMYETFFWDNYSYKRFLNQVVINGVTLYSQQKKPIISANNGIPSSMTLTITNPYLDALLNTKDTAPEDKISLKSPLTSAVNPNATGIFGTRGDELSTITLTIHQKPKKNLLTFQFNKQETDNLIDFCKGDFNPNKGLRVPTKNQGSVEPIGKDGAINYQDIIDLEPLQGDPTLVRDQAVDAESSFWKDSSVLVGNLNNNTINTLNSINNFDIHKKPRLYLKHRGSWYTAKFSNIGGYNINGLDYIGRPRFYEYVQNIYDSSSVGCMIPGVRKEPVKLSSRPSAGGIYAQLLSETRLVLPGSTAYFRIPETVKIHDTQYEDIADFAANEDPETTELKRNQFVKLKNQDSYYIYKGPTVGNKKSYLFIGSLLDILKNRSSLDIDYNNTSNFGLVYNTFKDTDTKVLMSKVANPFNPDGSINEFFGGDVTENTVVSKSLQVEFYDENDLGVGGTYDGNKHIRVYTIFNLLIKNKYQYVFLNETPGTILWYDVPDHTDPDPRLNNSYFKSKWGDIIPYDGSAVNNPYIITLRSLLQPDTVYENIFYKTIINDYQSNYKIWDGQNVSNLDDPYMQIFQKYNGINQTESYDLPVEQYKNFIPVMQLNYQKPVNSKYNVLNNSIPASGNIAIGSLVSNIDRNIEGYETPVKYSKRFFVDDVSALEGAFVPDPDKEFYTETFRLDDSLFWLSSTKAKNEVGNLDNLEEGSVNNAGQIRDGERFTPELASAPKYFASVSKLNYNFNINYKERETPYYTESIISDLDQAYDCGPQDQYYYRPYYLEDVDPGEDRRNRHKVSCVFKKLGETQMYAKYGIPTPKKATYGELNDCVKGFVSYEAGAYNPLGDNRFVEIVRTELGADNPIDEPITCSSEKPKPQDKYTISDAYQGYVRDNHSSSSHSTNVKNTDIHANEMLFRLLYGEKDFINKEQLFVDKKPLTKKDLINYTDPSVKAKDIYEEILYNFDANPRTDINVNGSISINGTRSVGDSITGTIGDISISLYIYLMGPTGDIVLEGNVGEEKVFTKIYDTQGAVRKSLITQTWSDDEDEPEAPSPTDENDTIDLVSQASYRGAWEVKYPFCERTGETYTRSYMPWSYMPWIYYRVPYVPVATTCPRATTPADPYTYGYCSVDPEQEDCGCDTEDGQEFDNYEGLEPGLAGVNFTYEFEDCSKKFKLHGHSYRPKWGDANQYELADYYMGALSFSDNTWYPGKSRGGIYDDAPEYTNGSLAGFTAEHRACFGSCWFENPYTWKLWPDYESLIAAQAANPYTGGQGIHGIHWGYAYYTGIKDEDKQIEQTAWAKRGSSAYVSDWQDTGYSGPFRCSNSDTGQSVENGCAGAAVVQGATQNRKVYVRTSKKELAENVSIGCASSFININYDNDTLTVTVPDSKAVYSMTQGKYIQSSSSKSYCVDVDFKGKCPVINIDVPSDYEVSETINSDCDDHCSQPSIEIEAQEQKYSTRDLTVVCPVSTFSYADWTGGGRAPNYRGCDGSVANWIPCGSPRILIVGNNTFNNIRFYGMRNSFVPSATVVECDAHSYDIGRWSHIADPINRQAAGNTQLAVAGPTSLSAIGQHAGSEYRAWKKNIEQSYGGGVHGRNSTQTYYHSALASPYDTRGNACYVQTDIPTEDIVEGIIPGTCQLKFEGHSDSHTKFRAKVGAGESGIETGEFQVSYVTAYLEYKYRSSYTVDSYLRSADNEDEEYYWDYNPRPGVGKYPGDYFNDGHPTLKILNGLTQCKTNPFPDRFLGTNYWGEPLRSPETYLFTADSVSANACDRSLSSYNKYDDKQTICTPADWQCWSHQDRRNTNLFLTRLTGNTWE